MRYHLHFISVIKESYDVKKASVNKADARQVKSEANKSTSEGISESTAQVRDLRHVGGDDHLQELAQNGTFDIIMHRLLKDNIDQIRTLCTTYNVKSLFAFGSICTNKFSESSDIDLLISLNPMDSADYADTYFTLADKFEELFNRPVDLITDKSLSNPYFISSINQTKTQLYG